MTKLKRYILLIFLFISIFLYYFLDWRFVLKNDHIYLALAGPMSGQYSSIGKCMLQGASLCIDEINQAGGIDGKKIVLDPYDDKNDPRLAKEIALQIANTHKYIAVIGHYYSDCSVNAGSVYKKYKIPVITSTSSNPFVTKDNEWYFRNVHDNCIQSNFMASCIKKVCPDKNISIIYEPTNYGKNTCEIFEKAITDLGLSLKYKWKIDPTDEKLDEKIRRIVFDIQFKNDAGIIFLACYAEIGVKLIKALKDNLVKNQIIATASLASEAFQKGISKLKKEKKNPGFYTNGLIVTTPIIFDAMSEKGQHFYQDYIRRFGSRPGWHAALTYETILLLVNALENSGIDGKADTIEPDRQKIRDYLVGKTSPSNAVKGFMGPIFFNENRDAQKQVFTGIYQKNQIVSTPIQFQPIHNIFSILDFNDALREKKILLLNGQFMYKTNIVYTGIDVKEIYNVNFKSGTFFMKFNLWFRFEGQLHPENIHFINSTDDIQLDLEKKKIINNLSYLLYHVNGQFKMDFLPKKHTFHEHILGVSFRHNELTRDNLIYLVDTLSTGNFSNAYLEQIQQAQIINPALGWRINDCYFFQSIEACPPIGNPKYLNVVDGLIKYSRYNMGIRINKNEFTLRNIIHADLIHHVFIFSIFCLICMSFVISKDISLRYSRTLWLMQAFFSFCLIISLESVLNYNFSNHLETYQIYILKTIVSILWWTVPSILICLAIKRFIWNPLEIKTGRIIPDIIVSFVNFFIYLLTFFGIIAFVFDQKITSLLATSGVFAMIIGLAVQINISNFFSGIAINIETPFKIGDWIKIGNEDPGKVLDITWRTTRLQTIDDSVVSVPNSIVSESLIHNYHYPTKVFRSWFTIHIDNGIPPEKVKKVVIQSLAKIDCICADPAPVCYYKGLTEWSSKYLVAFSIMDYSSRLRTVESVWTEVWHTLKNEDITLALSFPTYLKKGIL